jgi:nucleoside-diphosphate kinase
MSIERTFSIIKPDGVEKGLIGCVISRFEAAGLKPIAIKLKLLSQVEAEGFYAVHRDRPFFADLVKFMTSGPVVLMVLEGEGAIAKNREVMGATDPKKATSGTIRADLRRTSRRTRSMGQTRPRRQKSKPLISSPRWRSSPTHGRTGAKYPEARSKYMQSARRRGSPAVLAHDWTYGSRIWRFMPPVTESSLRSADHSPINCIFMKF